MQNTVHFILQGKGGIGKSFVSSMVSQYLKAKDADSLKVYDTDQENTTMAHYKGLNVKHIPVLNKSRVIDAKGFDSLMVDLLEGEGNFVVDTGANTFSPLAAYMIDNGAFQMLRDAGKTVYVHTIVGGGDTLADTTNGFISIAQSIDSPLVVWLNAHFGELTTPDGKEFLEHPAFKKNSANVRGVVLLPQRNPDTYGADIKKMNTARLTLDEIANDSGFNIMEKQRLKNVFRDVFTQLDSVEWN